MKLTSLLLFVYMSNLPTGMEEPDANRYRDIGIKNDIPIARNHKVIATDVLKQGNLKLHESARQLSCEVEGVVTDFSGAILQGVSIFANDRIINISDTSGRFSFKVNSGTKINFSYMGYKTYSTIVTKSEKKLRVVLEESVSGLDEVVVTALGIEREKKQLGYAAQQISGSEVQDAPTNNWINALNGKAPGVMLNTADGPMGSSSIVLRGEKSLSLGSSGALIVVDGVIISNEVGGNNAKAGSGDESPVDYGSTMSDINPDDIESISVLKGPGATALYGSRGANGAIIITTKSGGSSKGLGITFSSNTRINTVNSWPDYQYEYGQSGMSSYNYYSYGNSEDGKGITSTSDWGAKLNTGVKYYQYDPVTHKQSAERLPWVSYPDNRRDFLQTGLTSTNAIAVEGGNKTTQARLSVSNLQNRYILPNTGYQRTSVNVSLNHQLSSKIKLGTKLNYTNKSSDNVPKLAYNNRSISYFLMRLSPNMDSEWFKDYWETKDISQRRPFSSLSENPYFVLNEQLNPMRRNGAFGNVNFSYTIIPQLTLTAQSGIDMYQDVSSSRYPRDSRYYNNGYYKEDNVMRYEINSNFMLAYKETLSPDFKLGVSVGGNKMNYTYNRTRASVNFLDIPGVFTLSNGANRPILSPYKSAKAINSLYGFANLSYKDYLFLELTGRNDWSSALAPGNNSYFYPSINSSIVLSDLFKWRSKVIPYAKLRLSYAEVGNDTDPYRTEDYYATSGFDYSRINSTTRANKDLKPERTRSYEAGMEASLFNNRAGFDVTAYRADTYDQILSVPVERASGYYNAMMNAGTVRNQGLELQFWFKPIYNKLKWRLTLNAAANRGTIMKLSENIESITMYSGAGGATILGVEGGSMGDIYGLGYVRNSNGDIIYEGGLPVLGTEIHKVGNAIPQWKGGIMNQFRYKNWSLSVLVDGEFGHDKYSVSFSRMMTMGKLKQTLPGREEGALLGVGVVQNDDGTFRRNDVAVMPSVYYPTTYQLDNAEANTLDASFLKLREVTLNYTIKSKYLTRLGIRNPSIGLYGRDLFIWTKWPVYDPESGTLDEGMLVAGLDVGQFPSTRSLGVNLRVSF